jgi:23S rRNA pseudouridine2457 synthase
MAALILLNKPYGVLCQFSGPGPTLADLLDQPGFYPAGRLDKDSEGLVLLTNSGQLQTRIADPKHKMPKEYWVQVEGEVSDDALQMLRTGVLLKDGKTRPASVNRLNNPLPAREPAVRYRRAVPTNWLLIKLKEGRNRQIRRMTAAVGNPCLRIYRYRIGPWSLEHTPPGESRLIKVNLPR